MIKGIIGLIIEKKEYAENTIAIEDNNREQQQRNNSFSCENEAKENYHHPFLRIDWTRFKIEGPAKNWQWSFLPHRSPSWWTASEHLPSRSLLSSSQRTHLACTQSERDRATKSSSCIFSIGFLGLYIRTYIIYYAYTRAHTHTHRFAAV